MTITDKICPNIVGVDIGCGMYTVKLQNQVIDFEKIDAVAADIIEKTGKNDIIE